MALHPRPCLDAGVFAWIFVTGLAFARSKIGEGHVVDAYLRHVVDLYVQIHATQKIPDPLGLSVYACVPAVR